LHDSSVPRAALFTGRFDVRFPSWVILVHGWGGLLSDDQLASNKRLLFHDMGNNILIIF
jgi:hypothetical protein